MQIQFFLDGVVVPAVYDFELGSDGVMKPTQHHSHSQYVAILLENEGDGITLAQAAAVNALLIMNPNSDVNFFFETQNGEPQTIH